jgi:serpin B
LKLLLIFASILAFVSVFVASESFAQESEFIASPKYQLESGIDPENIICREDRVLVLRPNGNPACVKETTPEKLGWRIVETDSNIIEDKSKKNSIPSDSTVEYNEIIDANNKFAFEFYSQIKDENENIFYSPWSIMTAFAIVNEGAKANTAEQMQNVFGFSSNETQRQNVFKQVNDELNQEDSSYSLEVANSLWLAERFEPLQEYVDIATAYYDSEVSTVDFISNEGVNKINTWVEEKTNEKIKDILAPGSTDELTRLVIANAIYFKGTWVTQFDEENTEDQDFTVNSDTIVKTAMMNLYQSQQVYGETEEIKILELPYEGDKLSMLLLLPKEIDSMDKLENLLSVENFNQWRESLTIHDVNTVSIPKFELETDYNLIPPLSKLGLNDAFDPENADFSGIVTSEQLFITAALHKAYVDVNEEGTEAAAVTAISIGTTSVDPNPPPVFTFVADHPFIFVIQNNETGHILFIGKMTNPSE